MALITDYATLKTAVADWLARADLTGVIPTFIQLAESRLNRDVKSPRLTYEHLGTISSYTIAFPERFYIENGAFCEILSLSVSIGGRDVTLEPLTPSIATDAQIGGIPRGYYVIENSIAIIGGNGDEAYTLRVKNSLPQISSSRNNYTNWVLQKAPELYLYATLLEASPYLKADSRMGVWAEGYRVALESLNAQEERLTRGPGIRIKPVHYAP